MSAAVATLSHPQKHPHSASTSRMGVKSPVDQKRHGLNTEDRFEKGSAPSSSQDAQKRTPPRPDPPSVTKQAHENESKPSNAETSQPLAPPPRPAQHNLPDTPGDYFSTVHNQSHFSLEPNPFEQSFGNTAAETPGKSLLPPVAALASPASLLPGGASSTGFNWPNSLRSGPLSPAMLTGPAGPGDYFDAQIRAGFPTPNESSLRTGLTPGGGGSMFPAPSPNSQALFQQLASGGATPSTLDFHRTAMNAAAARKSDAGFNNQAGAATTRPPEQPPSTAHVDEKQQPPQSQANAQSLGDPFTSHDANDAANGLFLLAQARNGSQTQSQYPADRHASAASKVSTTSAGVTAATAPSVDQTQETSPTTGKRPGPARPGATSLRGSLSGSVTGMSEMSGDFSESGASEQPQPAARKAKRSSAGKGAQGGAGRRKAEDTPSKEPSSKKSKGNSGNAVQIQQSESPDEMNMKEEMLHPSGRKMTDEEKRKNFLERNRVAALKCRQRKKQWLANLQAKVEIFSSENDALSAQVTQLREEVVNLKTLLLAHKDCPVSQAQGLGGLAMNGLPSDFANHASSYGLSMANNGQMMAGRGMQRG